ncbi:hypothetical protein GZL_04820 [Streptomyces sp. 769]|nr:hypothetical protein GZL_04820 [Streptomyces sp. 769]
MAGAEAICEEVEDVEEVAAQAVELACGRGRGREWGLLGTPVGTAGVWWWGRWRAGRRGAGGVSGTGGRRTVTSRSVINGTHTAR